MRTISVIPNPYIALDKDGVPQGTVGAGMPGVFIGASIDLVASRKTGKTRFYYPKNGDGSLTRKVILSSDIVTAVLAGELLAATIEDARVCGVSDEEYLAPEKVLASEREKALAYGRERRDRRDPARGDSGEGGGGNAGAEGGGRSHPGREDDEARRLEEGGGLR